MFSVVRLTESEAQVERKEILEALKQQHELYLRALEEQAIHSKSRRLKKKIKQVAQEQVLPDQDKIRADLKLIESSSPLHHSIDQPLVGPVHPSQSEIQNDRTHYLFTKTTFQTPRRPSRNIERPDYCALAGEGLRKRSLQMAEAPDIQQPSKESESYKESDDEDNEFPEVVVMRQRQEQLSLRGRPRKGMEGIKRHAILQIKCVEGLDRVQKNSEVQMILDKIYGRGRAQSEEDQHTPRLTDDSYIEAGTRTASEPQSLRKRSYRPPVQASPIVATNKGDYQLANVLLGSTHGRVNMENWTNQASIQTPDFKINLVRGVVEEEQVKEEDELTDDDFYMQRHIQEERREKSRELIAQTIMRPNYRKKKTEKATDGSSRKRGRPPRVKRFKKKSNRDLTTSQKDEDFYDQNEQYIQHVRINMNEANIFQNGEGPGYYYQGEEELDPDYYEEISHDEQDDVILEEECEDNEDQENKDPESLLHDEEKEEGGGGEDLLIGRRRSRASSFSSVGERGFTNGGSEYRISTFFQAPTKDILLEREGEWKRERMFSTDQIHEH